MNMSLIILISLGLCVDATIRSCQFCDINPDWCVALRLCNKKDCTTVKECYNDDCTFNGIVLNSSPECEPVTINGLEDPTNTNLETLKLVASAGFAIAAEFPGGSVGSWAGGLLLDLFIRTPQEEPGITQQQLDTMWNDLINCIDRAVAEERGYDVDTDFSLYTARLYDIFDEINKGFLHEPIKDVPGKLGQLESEVTANLQHWTTEENYNDINKVIEFLPAYNVAINVLYLTSMTYLGLLYDDDNGNGVAYDGDCNIYDEALDDLENALDTYNNYITKALATFDSYYKPTGYKCSTGSKFILNWNEGNEEAPVSCYMLWDEDCATFGSAYFQDVIMPGFSEFRENVIIPSKHLTQNIVNSVSRIDNICKPFLPSSIPSGDYLFQIRFPLNSRWPTVCLKKKSPSTSSGPELGQCIGDDDLLLWKTYDIQNDNTYFKIKSNSGFCMRLSSNSMCVGPGECLGFILMADCDQIPSNGEDALLWQYHGITNDGEFWLRNKKDNQCLYVSMSTSSSKKSKTAPCGSSKYGSKALLYFDFV